MRGPQEQVLVGVLLGIRNTVVAILGISEWPFHAFLVIPTTGLIYGVLVGILIHAKVRPGLDWRRVIAYNKLAQMERTDFSILGDTVICDRDGRQIGLISAGHYQYIDILHISMNIRDAYITQEDRHFKSHTGVDWIIIFHARLALIKHGGTATQGGSTITQ